MNFLFLTTMRNPFHRKNRYPHQDRITMRIADRYDKVESYKTARRKGYTPVEALEDWDLLDEEAIKKLNEE